MKEKLKGMNVRKRQLKFYEELLPAAALCFHSSGNSGNAELLIADTDQICISPDRFSVKNYESFQLLFADWKNSSSMLNIVTSLDPAVLHGDVFARLKK